MAPLEPSFRGSSNGRTAGSGPVNEGSNPSPRATETGLKRPVFFLDLRYATSVIRCSHA